jgi:SAM-dependent methyltransferase
MHWEKLHAARPSEKQSWYEADPAVSLRLLSGAIRRGGRSVVDVGAGASTLVDRLLGFDLEHIAVIDISQRALEVARVRLGSDASKVDWIVADITAVDDIGSFDIWHDRAVLHFLTDTYERERYVQLSQRTVVPGGSAIIATFAPSGPEMCSGLPVMRYGADTLSEVCGPPFDLVDSEPYVHTTPRGVHQAFTYTTFRRTALVDRYLPVAN